MRRAHLTAVAAALAFALPILAGEKPSEARARSLIAASPQDRAAALAQPPADLDGLYRALALESLRLQRSGQLAGAIDVAGLALAVAIRTNDLAGQTEALWLTGSAQDLAGQRAEAERSLAESLRLAHETGDAELRVKALGALAVCDYRASRWDAAEGRLRQALELARSAQLVPAAARLSSTLGEVFRIQGRHDEARTACAEGLRLARQVDSAPHVAIAANCLAIVDTARGEYASALHGFDVALGVAQQQGLYENRVAALNNLGMVQQLQGDRGQALAYYDDVRTAAEAAGDRAGLARALLNSGALLRDLGRLDEGGAALGRGAALAEELGDAELRAHAALCLGDLEYTRGKPADAAARYEVALRLRGGQPVPALEAALLQRLADVDLLRGDWAGALRRAERSERLAAERGDREALWRARTSAGRALLGLGQIDPGRRAFEQAVEIIEELRATLAGPGEQRQLFLENKLDPYRALSGLCLAQGRAEEALSWSERSRARLLFDMLAAGRVDLDRHLSAGQRAEQQRLRRELAEAGRLARSAAAPAEAAARRQRLETARRQLAAFLAALYAAHPELQLRRADLPLLKLADLAPLVPDPQTALLEYLWDEERVQLFVITRDASGVPRLAAFALQAVPADLRRLVREFRTALEGRDLEAGTLAARLHEAVLAPARSALGGVTHLKIVPDGPLWELPFQALSPARGRFLIEERALSLAPSLGVLLHSHRRAAPARPSASGLLALGDPDLPASPRPAALARMDAGLPQLPEARLQIAELGRLYGPHSALLVGPSATEAAVREQAGRHRVLHFATHGLLNDASPMHSQLVLAPPAEGQPDDGLLEAREVLDLDLHADLAVLSACQTGRGRVAGGEGLLGFPWAFLARGCPATVVSQWSVDSAATRALMLAFHRRLRAGSSPARALQAAARELLRRPAWRQPFFWAAFVLVGSSQ